VDALRGPARVKKAAYGSVIFTAHGFNRGRSESLGLRNGFNRIYSQIMQIQ
jgi:hypothetical protein